MVAGSLLLPPNDLLELTNSGDWRGLSTIGFVKLTTFRAGKPTEQVRYFISSLPLGLKTFARAIRSH